MSAPVISQFDLPTAAEAAKAFEKFSASIEAAGHPEAGCSLFAWSGDCQIKIQRRDTGSGTVVDLLLKPGVCLTFEASEAHEIACAILASEWGPK